MGSAIESEEASGLRVDRWKELSLPALKELTEMVLFAVRWLLDVRTT